MGYKKYKEWGRSCCAKDKCCNCRCNCECCCNKEEPKKKKKEECCENGKLVFVFNTCIDGDVEITDSFRDNLKENFNNNTDNFKIKDSFRDAVIVKDILSHNAIEILNDILSHNAIEILNEAFKNVLRDSLNHSGNDEDNTEINDNFSCNEDSFEIPIGNEETNSSSCAKSEGFSIAIAKNKLDEIEEYEGLGEEGINNV